MPKFLKNIWFWTTVVLVVAFVVIPLACGYTLGFLTNYQWQASNVIGLLGVVGSLAAVLVAISVPSRIAKQQNKVAIYNKRCEVYNILRTIYCVTGRISDDRWDNIHYADRLLEVAHELNFIFPDKYMLYNTDIDIKLMKISVLTSFRIILRDLENSFFLFDTSLSAEIVAIASASVNSITETLENTGSKTIDIEELNQKLKRILCKVAVELKL